MSSEPHPVAQLIERIFVWAGTEGLVETGAYPLEGFAIGHGGVTRLEACTKPGLHADIPYVRVWADEICLAEFCQHNIVGIYFTPSAPTPPETDELASCGHHYASFECSVCSPF